MRIKYLDGKRFYLGLLAGSTAVIDKQNYLNKINVFPVADADTGINLAMTMQAILESSKICNTLKETLHSIADSALNGARGNSGKIFAQYLHGLSHEIPEVNIMTTKHFALSAHRAVKHLYASLMNPVEGTMLTVIREWAETLVELSSKSTDFFHLITDSLIAAQKSLKETPLKLKVLAEAGVVDAGASGFVIFLEGIVDYIRNGSLKTSAINVSSLPESRMELIHTTAPDKYRYCAEAVLSDSTSSVQKIKDAISLFGDSLILAGDQNKLHIHIHTNEPDQLFSKLFELGKVSGSKVDDMLRQYQISHDRKYPIGLVTDTACDLPQNILDEYQISRIPFGINFGSKLYLDSLTIRPEGFYHLLKNDTVHPLSSQPSPAVVKHYLEYAASHYDQVIAVHISDKLSGIFQSSSVQANKMNTNKIATINSHHLSVSEGLVTLRIARAIADGMKYEEIIHNTEQWISKTKIYTDINTLKYMVRGGRVKPLTGLIAAILNLKPIISLDAEGKALAYGKSFSRKSNMKKIINIIKRELAQNNLWEYAIVHAQAQERAEEYATLLTAITGKKPAYIMSLSPVVGVHNGIGAVGIGVSYD